MTDIIPLEEMTVKELQAEATRLGLQSAELFKTKAILIAAMNSLRKVKVEPTEVITPPVSPKEERVDEKRWLSKVDKMREALENQPKVRVLIPLEGEEKQGVVEKVMVRGVEETKYVSGAVWSKTFNGYKVIIPKGVYTDVPEQVAENISQEYNQTQHAGDQWSVDRVDPKTGRPVSEQL
jgi:hypothetical protein